MAVQPLELFLRARRECGDVARLRFGPFHAYCFFHPRHVQHVLVGNAANYEKQTRGYRILRVILGNGLVTSEGAFWKRQRRIAQPAFHDRRIHDLTGVMLARAAEHADRWERIAGTGERVDVAAEMSGLTLRIACEALFGHESAGETEAVGEAIGVAIERFLHLAAAPIPYPHLWPTPKNLVLRRALGTLDRVVYAIIAERRQKGADRPDLLSLLMSARDEETGESMNDRQLRDEVLTMLLAGHETTANALAWSFHLLSQHPTAAERLEAELDARFGAGPITVEGLRATPWVSAVLDEAMRLYPPIWALGRRAVAEDHVDGNRIHPGQFVFLSAYITHRHPAMWPDGERFDPGRFVDGDPARRALDTRGGAYFPFSAGQRKCIGEQFALLEGRIILATLARRFRPTGIPGHSVEPEPSVTLRPRGGVPMTIARRAG